MGQILNKKTEMNCSNLEFLNDFMLTPLETSIKGSKFQKCHKFQSYATLQVATTLGTMVTKNFTGNLPFNNSCQFGDHRVIRSQIKKLNHLDLKGKNIFLAVKDLKLNISDLPVQ